MVNSQLWSKQFHLNSSQRAFLPVMGGEEAHVLHLHICMEARLLLGITLIPGICCDT